MCNNPLVATQEITNVFGVEVARYIKLYGGGYIITLQVFTEQKISVV